VSTPGRRFMAALIDAGKVDELVNMGRVEHLFRNTEPEMWAVFESHLHDYGVFPSRQLMKEKTGEDLPTAPEPPRFYLDQMVDRHLELSMRAAVEEAGTHLVGAGKSPRKAYEHLLRSMVELELERSQGSVHDFRHAYDVVWPAYKAKAIGSTVSIPFGWKSFDEASSGMQPGDVVSIVGRPWSGKTWTLAYVVDQAHRSGRSVLLVTMEMSLLAMEQRMLALRSGIAIERIRQQGGHALTDVNLKQLQQASKQLAGMKNPLTVVDGQRRAPTVKEIAALARHQRPDLIAVDAAYLLKHPNARLSRWDRVAENTDELKELASSLGVPVLATWQLSREAVKKVRSGKGVGLEDIGYSDAIGQISSIVMAFLDEDTPENLRVKRVEVPKDRDGSRTEFRINFDLQRMDLSEYVEPKLEDLKVA